MVALTLRLWRTGWPLSQRERGDRQVGMRAAMTKLYEMREAARGEATDGGTG